MYPRVARSLMSPGCSKIARSGGLPCWASPPICSWKFALPVYSIVMWFAASQADHDFCRSAASVPISGPSILTTPSAVPMLPMATVADVDEHAVRVKRVTASAATGSAKRRNADLTINSPWRNGAIQRVCARCLPPQSPLRVTVQISAAIEPCGPAISNGPHGDSNCCATVLSARCATRRRRHRAELAGG